MDWLATHYVILFMPLQRAALILLLPVTQSAQTKTVSYKSL